MTARTCNWPGCTEPPAAKSMRRCRTHSGHPLPKKRAPKPLKPPAPSGEWCTPCGRRVNSLIHTPARQVRTR